jgi:hypothetical protein
MQVFVGVLNFIKFDLALAYGTWVAYLAIVAVLPAYRAGRLSRITVLLASPLGATGVVLDVLLNVFFGSIIFLERPHEWFLTRRCDRLMLHGNIRQANWATWICKNLLDPFQIGGHCLQVPGKNAPIVVGHTS